MEENVMSQSYVTATEEHSEHEGLPQGAQPLPFAAGYTNAISPAIDFIKASFLAVAGWIRGQSNNQSDEPSEGKRTPFHVQYFVWGVIFLVLSWYTAGSAFVLNRMGAGAVFPDSSYSRIKFLWWILRVEPASALALVLTCAAVVTGFLAVHNLMIFLIELTDTIFERVKMGANPRREDQRKSAVEGRDVAILTKESSAKPVAGDAPRFRPLWIPREWLPLTTLAALSASLATYRLYVMNGYVLLANNFLLFAMTVATEMAFAVVFSLAVCFILNFVCVAYELVAIASKGMSPGLRVACRFLAGLVSFGVLVLCLIPLECAYVIVKLPVYWGMFFDWRDRRRAAKRVRRSKALQDRAEERKIRKRIRQEAAMSALDAKDEVRSKKEDIKEKRKQEAAERKRRGREQKAIRTAGQRIPFPLSLFQGK